jgi:transcriptional regulator with XRE-family HTH domain
MTENCTTFRFIRESVFGISTQHEFAKLLRYEQATVSRFESGARRMSLDAQERIRALARRRGIRWDNNWFFEIPEDFPRVADPNVRGMN